MNMTVEICNALGVSAYYNHGYSAKDAAQEELNGRSYYVDNDTLRFFYSRILSARAEFDGLFYRITESYALDYNNTTRGFRCVVFDLTGEIVYRPETPAKTSATATTAFHTWKESFNPRAYYIERLADIADRKTREIESLNNAIKELAK